MQVETVDEFLARGGKVGKHPVTFDNDHMKFKWTNKGHKGSAKGMKERHVEEAAKPELKCKYGLSYAGRGY